MKPALFSRRTGTLVFAVACIALTGCVSKSTNGAATTYKFEWWIPTLITLVGLGALLLGVLFLTMKKIQNGLISAIIGLGVLMFGPAMFFDKVVVDPDHFELRTGFWFSPTAHNIKFDNVASINGSMEESRGRRGRKNTSFYLNFTLKSGGSEKVPVGDMMKRGPYDDIVVVATLRGIPVTGVGPVMD